MPGHGGVFMPNHNFDPIRIRDGYRQWPHWDRPFFARPDFDFNWAQLRLVTCIATDSNGDEFPITEDEFWGYNYMERLTSIEDQAIDRCFAETNGDTGCALLTCNAGY